MAFPTSLYPSSYNPPHLPHTLLSTSAPIPTASLSLSLSLVFIVLWFRRFERMMKIVINPKKLFKSKKGRSVSRSESSSFSCGMTSYDSPDSSSHHRSSSSKANGPATPTSVSPAARSREVSSGDWSDDISPDVNYELVQAFRLIDGDGDGRIARADLESLLSRVAAEPLSEEELSMMLSEIDRDGDGSITLEEFRAVSSVFGMPAGRGELREAFDFFDADRDGRITAEEVFAVFRSMGDAGCTIEDCRRMIGAVDKIGDGFVCFEDFALMMEQQRL